MSGEIHRRSLRASGFLARQTTQSKHATHITKTGDFNVTIDDQIWIGQNGEKYGPYSEATVRQWLAEGKFAPDALAWREGIADWVPLTGMFSASANRQQPPPAPPGFRSAENAYASQPYSTQSYGQISSLDAERAELPLPPSLHWGLLLLLDVLTLGIFGIVWIFIQANWVRKIDAQSNAILLLALAIACFVLGEPIYLASLFKANGGFTGWASLGALLLFARWVLYLVAYFSMAGSMERRLKSQELPLRIGRITLFFFTMYYLQAQLTWLARWKTNRQISPAASKGTIWATFYLLLPGVAGIFAAITIPAYQDYITRTQVAESIPLANGAKTAMMEYYHKHQALPSDNASAGLPTSTSIAGKYVSSVNVAGGAVTVSFDTPDTNSHLRYQSLVFFPVIKNGVIRWDCSRYSTVPTKVLPEECRA